MPQIISINGTITPVEEAKISAFDSGFLYGDSIFETFVAFSGKILDPLAHIERLNLSSSQVGVKLPISEQELLFELESLAQLANLEKAMIRLVISNGPRNRLDREADTKSTRVIYCSPARVEPSQSLSDGLKLKSFRQNYTHRGPLPKKSNYLASIVAKSKATELGFDDIIWTNSNGEFTESSTSNIFFIGRQGDFLEICTPAVDSGILCGTTRNQLVRLLNLSKIKTDAQIIYKDEIARFDEAFLTSSVRGLVPISRIDEHNFHTTRKSAVFHHIYKLYLSWIHKELGFKVDWNTGARL